MSLYNAHYRNIQFLVICFLFYLLVSCNSMLQNKGNVKYENYYIDNINNGGMRYDNSFTNFISALEISEKDLSIDEKYFNKSEVIKMESLNELITVIGSAIAGVYCAVKAIINAIKKMKKN